MTDSYHSDKAIHLTIIGKGQDIERMQKRLRCAARATGNKLHLSWKDEYPRTLNIDAEQSTAVTCNDKLILDGLKPTEEIESLLIKLKENT